MKLTDTTLAQLATALAAERKRQKLSREDAAAICGVSTSFIRDAESKPESCSLGKLVMFLNGMGLKLEVTGFSNPAKTQPSSTDFGVADSQLVRPHD